MLPRSLRSHRELIVAAERTSPHFLSSVARLSCRNFPRQLPHLEPELFMAVSLGERSERFLLSGGP